MNENKPLTFGDSAMDRQIFNQNLSVHATSAYILIAACQTEGGKAKADLIRHRWTVGPEHLEEALNELKSRNIVVSHPDPENPQDRIYTVNPAHLWLSGE